LAKASGAILKFGRFRVGRRRREFFADGVPVPIGSKAFDVLMVLTEARGELVTKDEILGRVWPGMVVEEHSLQFHISTLRKLLGKDRAFIKTISGRGYRLVADVTVADEEEEDPAAPPAVPAPPLPNAEPRTNLAAPTSDLIGREAELQEATALLMAHRLVTFVGPGGIGKTRLALDVARHLVDKFADGAWVAELGSVSAPDLVPVAVATALKLEIAGGAAVPDRVAAALDTKRLLLVLDNCEHVIDASANMAAALLRANPAARMIATSREPLRAEGEWIYPVPPLAVPAEDAEDAGDPLCYGAVRLFVERAQAAEPHFAPNWRAVAMIAAICRQLDGIPLAIELAAACAAALGIEALATHLGDRFQLLISGQRTALPRHQTLRATFDWSYELLAERERVLLRRLGVFAGVFSLEAVDAVAADDQIAAPDVAATLASLIAKSLVAAEVEGAIARYRLLDTTRAYACEKLGESGESGRLARAHAQYYRDLFEQAESEWKWRPAAEWLNENRRHIDNLRAALDWAFSSEGDASIGVALTAAAVPLWMHLSLVAECRSRVEHALAVFDAEASRDAPRGMKLYAALATSLAYTGGTPPELEAAWTKTLEFAERLDDRDYWLRAAWELWCLNRGSRWRHAAMTQARRFRALIANRADPNHRLTGERMLGVSHHYLGDQASVMSHAKLYSQLGTCYAVWHVGKQHSTGDSG
jgi:predicted ATPase/DNA-binding winged helix-turn-helix (wHTH) protein